MSEPPKLTLLHDTVYRLDRPPESLSARAKRRHLEARVLALDHIDELRRAIGDADARAASIVEGGTVYPPGVRDLAQRLRDYLETQERTLAALLERLPDPRV